MYFASRVAVAVAPGTPGIGNVTTGLPDAHETDVWPTFARLSAKRVPGFAHNLDVRVRLSVRTRAGVLNPLAECLVVGACTIFRERARLPVHLNRALALIFEHCDHVAFIMALEHAHVPHPVEEHGLQISAVFCRCVRLRNPTWALR